MSAERRRRTPYERVLEGFARTPPGNWFVRKVAPRVDPPLLKLTGGRFSSVYPVPVMLLTTTGAKTGLARTHPLLYLADDEGLILIASNYGNPHHPAWYRNLIAHPAVDVLAGKHSGSYAAAEITDPAARERGWDLAVDMYAGYADYEVRAENRTIPLVRLRRD